MAVDDGVDILMGEDFFLVRSKRVLTDPLL